MPNEQKTDQGDELHISPTHEEHLWILGDDGELLPLDDQGHPIEPPMPPHVNPIMSWIRQRRTLLAGSFMTLLLGLILVGLLVRGDSGATLNGTPVRPEERLGMTQTAAVLTFMPTMYAMGTARAPTARATVEQVQVCERALPAPALDGVIVFAGLVNLSTMGQIFRIYPDNTNLCQMPNTQQQTMTVVALDATGEGAVFNDHGTLEHIAFFATNPDQIVQRPYLDPLPATVAASPRNHYHLRISAGVLWIVGSLSPLSLPSVIDQVLLAQWVAPSQ